MTTSAPTRIITKLWHKPWSETRRAIWGRLRLLIGLPAPMRTPDRKILESTIIPFFVARRVGRVLFVGTDWFTKHYDQFFPGIDYWTIEIEPGRRRFGTSQHIVDSLEHLDRHFPKAHFDLILCNGVFGWGLDDRASCEQAFQQCYECLRDEGVLMLGWNDVSEHRPFPPEAIQSLSRFARFENSPLGAWRYTMPTLSRHTYDFYTKHAGRC
jgi:methyltransferase family protein